MDMVAAKMSAKCITDFPLLSTEIPIAVMPSEMMSAVRARSVPPAIANCNRVGVVARMAFVFQPARPRYFCASATWVALNSVALPNSLACAVSFAMSSALAWVTACTLDIAYSKFFASSTAFAKGATIAAPVAAAATPAVAKEPAFSNLPGFGSADCLTIGTFLPEARTVFNAPLA